MNGVESITAAEGIRVVDTGGNRYTVGLNVLGEIQFETDVLGGVWPAGISELNLGEPQQLQFNGPYLVNVRMSAGSVLAGPMVAGPEDRIAVVLTQDDNMVLSVPMKIYSGVAPDEPQRMGIASVLMTQDEAAYQFTLQVYNISGTFEPRGIQITLQFIPLTSVQGPPPAAPAPILLSRR